jgi:hypothetical protein
MASMACTTCPAPAGPELFSPSERLAVLSIATSRTEEHDRPATGWALDEVAATILNQARAATISRSTVQRMRDRRPPRVQDHQRAGPVAQEVPVAPAGSAPDSIEPAAFPAGTAGPT